MQHELILSRRIACDENIPGGGRELSAGDLRQKVVGVFRGQAPPVRVVNCHPQEEEKEEKPLVGSHPTERTEVQQQRQVEQERECLRTQQMKSTLEEVVNASRERFIATHGPRRANSEQLQLRAADLELLDRSHTESRSRVGCVRAVAVPNSTNSSNVADMNPQACFKEAVQPEARGLVGQAPDLIASSSRSGNSAAVGGTMEIPHAQSASSSSISSSGPISSWAASTALPPARTRPGLQRERCVGIGRLGVGGQSTGRLEVNKVADRSASPSSRGAPELRARAAERRSDSLERRGGRSISPSSARQGGRASYLADTTASAQKRTGSQSRTRPNSAGPRVSDRGCREVSASSPSPAALKSRPPPSNTPRGLKGGARGGSTGTLHAVAASASGSLQAPAVTRQKSGGSSSSSTGIVKTPRGALSATSIGGRAADSSRPSLASSRSSDGSLGVAGLASSSSSSRGGAQEPPSPRSLLRRSGALSARASGSNSSGPAQRKRQSYGSLEASPGNGIASSGTSSPGTSSPPRSAQAWGVGWAGNSTAASSSRRNSQTNGPTVRPPQAPSTSENSGHRGGTVLAELNCLERLRQAGESPEPLIACALKLSSDPHVRQDETRTVRPGIRDRGLSELGATVVASVRLPAEKERLREVASKAASFENRCAAKPKEIVRSESSDVSPEVEKPDVELNSCDVPIESQAILPMPSCESVLQEPPASLLTSLSPLSPIREVAEGGATPKALDSREVLEVQANEARELQARGSSPSKSSLSKRQLDLDDQMVESHEDVVATFSQDSLSQLQSSKERYLQIRDRFLSK